MLRRGGKTTQKNYTEKIFHDPDNHGGVITHVESDNLECKIKWTLRSNGTNKASGGDGIPTELFQADNAVKVLHSICQQIWKSQQWHRTGKGQFSFQSQRKAMLRNVQATANCTHLTH